MCAAGHTRLQCHPPRMAPHDLHDRHPMMRPTRRVEPVDRLHRPRDRGVVPEAVIRRVHVIVDRLGHADGTGEPAALVKLHGLSERILPADRDERVDSGLPERNDRLLRPIRVSLFLREERRSRRSQDRAALSVDILHVRHRQRPEVSVQHAGPALLRAEHFEPVRDTPVRYPTNDRVQSRGIPSAGHHSNSHRFHLRVEPRAMDTGLPYVAFPFARVSNSSHFRSTSACSSSTISSCPPLNR